MIIGFLKKFNVAGEDKETDFERKIIEQKKLHTIRADVSGRWMVGKKIHFATGVRTSKYHQFYAGICTGIQDIKIENKLIFIDDRLLREDEVLALVLNDGFDSPNDF